MIYKNIFKRIFDIAFSAFLIFLLILPSLFIALIIKIVSRGPVIHWSNRVGKNNVVFKMPKFRSMNINTPTNIPTNLFKNPKAHIYPFGNFLRKTSLDEIPQLISILKGEMSFVGPRPYTPSEIADYKLSYWKKRHLVKPGITGLSQIFLNGRNGKNYSRICLDVVYVRNHSLSLDMYILFHTFLKLIRGSSF